MTKTTTKTMKTRLKRSPAHCGIMAACLSIAATVTRTAFAQWRLVVTRSSLVGRDDNQHGNDFSASNLMYSRRFWEWRANAKHWSRRAPYAGWTPQAEGGQGGLVILQALPPHPVLLDRRCGVVREDLVVSLHHVRVVQVIVHNHATLALKQNKIKPVLSNA